MKRKAKATPVWLQIAEQIGCILLIVFVLCAVAAAMVLGGLVPQEMIPIAALVCLGAGTAVGCRLALKAETKRKWIHVGILTGITALLLLLGNLLFAAGAPYGWLRVLIALVIGGTLAILTASGRKKRAGKRR